ncbi:hypothetical protein V1264_019174 [Littorina saxatilis]
MATNLRGQLGVKSGPLAPTSAKLTTQMLVVSHMENHYKKISKARPAIDNGPPKSMQSSQKLRDKRTKKAIETYGSRPASRVSYRSHSAEDDIYDERQWEEPEDDEERQVREIMRTTLRVPLKANHNIGSVNATDGSKSESANFQTTTMRPQSATMRGVAQAMRGLSHMNRTRPASARSTTSLVSNFSQTSRSSNPMKATYNGDVIEKHAHNFTEPTKPFTPRTLKSNRESSLKRYKYYTPPPKKSQQGTHREAGSAINGDTIVKEAPQAKPRARSAKGGGDMGATGTLTETMLMDMSLQSHDPRQNSASSKGIPRLDISMDKDHLSWVQDQATRAHIRTSNGTSVQSQDRAHHDGGDTLGETGTLGKTDTLRFTRTGSSAK